jgi:hypothetical protein
MLSTQLYWIAISIISDGRKTEFKGKLNEVAAKIVQFSVLYLAKGTGNER